LDWLALRGVNLPLAWVGYEKILLETFQDLGLTNAEISSFFSGPAYQAWNRFGNIQGSWGEELPMEWIEQSICAAKEHYCSHDRIGHDPCASMLCRVRA
jgi:alpha-N-acetylglucosaminidase